MAFKTKKEVIAAGMDFVNECYAIAEEYDEELEYDVKPWLSSYELRVEDEMIELECLYSAENVEDALGYCSEADCTVEELTGEEFTDGVILCEGFLYETLYYGGLLGAYSMFGEAATKALYQRLEDALGKHGFQLDLSRGGSILLECEESLEAQMNRRGN